MLTPTSPIVREVRVAYHKARKQVPAEGIGTEQEQTRLRSGRRELQSNGCRSERGPSSR